MALLVPPKVVKELAGLPRDVADHLLDRLERIAEAPSVRHPGVEALHGSDRSFRLRRREWRAVFTVDDNGDVSVRRVAHRREVYR